MFDRAENSKTLNYRSLRNVFTRGQKKKAAAPPADAQDAPDASAKPGALTPSFTGPRPLWQ